ncbi:MAG: phosphatidylglycerophosphatase A [Burkholderiaceae bacterium]|nr:MAG: phosphatidylglycerophosphatase A [Burkholderiaceae bacterium]
MSPAERPRNDVTDDTAPAPHPAPPPTADTAPAERPGASDGAEGPIRPDWRFLAQHPAHWIALGFGSGLAPRAPGTAGTLWAWMAWSLLGLGLTATQLGVLLALSLPVAWWACTVTAAHMRTADPGAIVADEIVAFWIILWLVLPAGFWGQLIAFALFRFFDAVKPGPVGWADRLFHSAHGWRGGFGIMLDDLVAAGCALLVIALWRVWW